VGWCRCTGTEYWSLVEHRQNFENVSWTWRYSNNDLSCIKSTQFLSQNLIFGLTFNSYLSQRGNYFQVGQTLNQTIDIKEAFQRCMETIKPWAFDNPRVSKSCIFLRSYAASHFMSVGISFKNKKLCAILKEVIF
jgi:hypothetical protein